MAYAIAALIVSSGPDVARFPSVVPLGAGLRLLPLSDANRESIDELTTSALISPVMGFEDLDSRIVEVAERLSYTARVGYVHAGSFGGIGFQAALGWEVGQVRCGPEFTANHEEGRPTAAYRVVGASDDAVNVILRFLGVKLDTTHVDEFAIVGLGRERFTDDW